MLIYKTILKLYNISRLRLILITLLHKQAVSQHTSQCNWYWQLLKSYDKTLKTVKDWIGETFKK